MGPMAQHATEPSRRWERIALASGVLAAAAFIAATALFIVAIAPGMAPLDAPAAERAARYASMNESVTRKLVSLLGTSQMLFLPLFFGGLFGVLRRAEAGSASLAAVVFAGGIVFAVITPLATLIEDHLLLGLAARGVDPNIVVAFDGLVPLSLSLSGFPQALVAAGTAALILSSGVAPRWLGWTGFGLAALSLAATLVTVVGPALFPVAALAALLFRLWILALSLALLGSSRVASPSPGQAAPA